MIGILISAPMGPIGMLVIQRTLSKGRLAAFATGLGAALSDLFYCLLTGFGLSFVTDIIESHRLLLQLLGGAVLAIFAVYLYRKNPTRSLKKVPGVEQTSFWKDFVTGFILTFSNPLILFFIIGLFARFNFFMPEYMWWHYIWAYLTILGGAVLWWYLITTLVNKLRSRVNVRSLWLVNRIIAAILMIMAIVGVADAFLKFL